MEFAGYILIVMKDLQTELADKGTIADLRGKVSSG